MRKHHFHLQYFSFYDLDGMARHLELMAAKGWMLEKMTTFGWHYRRMEPKRLRFAVTYQDTFSVFDPENSDGQMEYQDLCRSSGWEVAASNGPLQAFYTEDEDAPPIETDPQLFLETVERLARKTRFASIVIILAALINFWMFIGNLLQNPIHLLASPSSLASGLCWTLMALYGIIDLVTYVQWHRRAKAAAALGQFAKARSRAWLLRTILWAVVLALLYILLASRLPGYGLMLAMMLVVISLTFIVPATVQGLLKRRGVPAKVNKRCTILSNVTTALLVMVVLTAMIFIIDVNPSLHFQEADIAAPLTMADMTGSDDERYVERVHLDRSVFLDHFTCTVEAPFDRDANLPEISYEIVDVKFPPFYSLCRNALIDPGYGDGYVLRDPLTGVSAVYESAEGYDSYILCWNDRLVQLDADFPLTEPQLETAAAILAP